MKKYILLFAAIAFPLLVLFVYFALYSVNSDISGLGKCTFLEMTGYQCPGCGGQRSLYYMLHGDFLHALRHNLFFVVAAPFLAFFYFRCVQVYILKQTKYLDSFVFSSYFGYGLLIVVILFFILRNIPIDPFTYLAPPK